MCGCGWRASILTDCAQSCPTPCDPMDCSPPSSSVHGIFQARMLEEAAIPFSRGSSRPGDQTCIFCDSGTESGFFFIFIHLFGCVRSYSILRDLLLWLQDSPVAWAQLQVDSSPLSPQGTPPHTPRIKTPATAAGQGLEPQRWLEGRIGGGTGAPAGALCVGPVEGRPGGREPWKTALGVTPPAPPPFLQMAPVTSRTRNTGC